MILLFLPSKLFFKADPSSSLTFTVNFLFLVHEWERVVMHRYNPVLELLEFNAVY